MTEVELILPDNWQQIIDAGKYLDAVRVLNTYKSEAESRMAMLQALGVIDGFELGKQLGAANNSQRNEAADNIDYYEAMQIIDRVLPEMDYIYNDTPFPLYENPDSEDPELKSYPNPVPTFEHDGVVYEGPAIRAHSQTGEEWMITHHAQKLYNETEDIKHLLIVVAANYHPVVDGKRQAFDENTMLDTARKLASLPAEIIWGIYLWYMSADNWWFEKFEHVFSGEGDDEEPSGHEVRHIVFELAGNSMGNDWDIVKRRSRQDIFYSLDRLEAKREAIERQNKK